MPTKLEPLPGLFDNLRATLYRLEERSEMLSPFDDTSRAALKRALENADKYLSALLHK